MKKKVLGCMFAAFVALSMVGCGSESSAESDAQGVYNGEEGRITVYMSGPEAMVNELEYAFEGDRGDVVDIFHAGCGPLRQKVWTEVEADNVEADVFFGSNAILFNRLSDMGALEPYESPEASKIMDSYKTGTDDYTFVNGRYEVIVYDNASYEGDAIPRSYSDLADSRFAGKIAYTDPSQSSTGLALTCGLYGIENNSMDFFKSIKPNDPLIVPKSKMVPEKIESGEMGVGISTHDAIARINRKAKKDGIESNLGMAWPKDGAIRIERPIAIMNNDARPEANEKLAQEFVDFMLSDGQQITSKYAFYPVVEGYDTPKGLPEDPACVTIDWQKMNEDEDLVMNEFNSIMGE